jgi:ribosomal protein S18 acetylase RimI-like enzyme
LFQLSDQAIEQIIFAMEDQDSRSLVDLETGAVLSAEEMEAHVGGDAERFSKPPRWTSRDGYKLMEDFIAAVRNPSARRELLTALSRGRGVFKAFKGVLTAYPEIERAFKDFKTKFMRRSIVEWYESLREAQGLARLGPEPESDSADLLASDSEIRILDLEEARPILDGLITELADEATEYLPAAVADFELRRLRSELEAAAGALCAFVEDGEGGALGGAVAFRELTPAGGFGRIPFMAVRQGFRRMGIGRALLDALGERLGSEGFRLVVLDSAFFPQGFVGRLPSLGFDPYGARASLKRE